MIDLQITFTLPHWMYWGGLLLFPLVMMWAVRRAERRAGPRDPDEPLLSEQIEERVFHDRDLDLDALHVENAFTRFADRLSTFTGVFVAYWTVIAVVAYFYEVFVRYFFNSPTNWAHESMFLMFGMQYLIAGAYAFLHDAHVRVDLFYSKAGIKGKAALDIFTFVFFLIFVLALAWTGWTFFSNSVAVDFLPFATGYANERSFTEWQIAYWPVKATIFIGAVLLLIEGLARVVKDILVLRRASELEEKGHV